MIVYISKYALSKGIFEMEAEVCESTSPDMIVGVGQNKYTFYHGKGKNWHLTTADAIAAAKKKRDNKINSLKEQISKLEQLTFD